MFFSKFISSLNGTKMFHQWLLWKPYSHNSIYINTWFLKIKWISMLIYHVIIAFGHLKWIRASLHYLCIQTYYKCLTYTLKNNTAHSTFVTHSWAYVSERDEDCPNGRTRLVVVVLLLSMVLEQDFTVLNRGW